MKKIIIGCCIECPLTEIPNDIEVCNHKKYKLQGGRIFNTNETFKFRCTGFPKWCPLSEYIKIYRHNPLSL